MVDKGGNGMTSKRVSLVQTIIYLIFCDKNVISEIIIHLLPNQGWKVPA